MNRAPNSNNTSTSADSFPAKPKHITETTQLRLLFLSPLALAIVVIVAALTLALYYHEYKNVDKGVMRIRASAQSFYEDSVRYDAQALQAAMSILKHDHVLRDALKNSDRHRLLEHSSLLFQEIKHAFAITHLYFTSKDRVNILRAHAPQRYGDLIDRNTTRSAEEHGTTVHGVELGPLGTFTLRLVSPWFDEETHELIGYVELGMEIDRVLQQLRDFFGVEVYVLIHKEHLDRQPWEDGMRALGRTPNWDRYPTVVLGSQGQTTPLPHQINDHLNEKKLDISHDFIEIEKGGSTYRIVFLPLHDAGNRHVAHMVLQADVSHDIDLATRTVIVGSVAVIVSGILLFVFFHWQVGRIGHRIEADELELEHLATHDGLTGLYNHRYFYQSLEDEIERARRYKHTLALLMIDIDHFKNVNDQHGHQAGDAILKGLSSRLTSHARSIDRVCRYGGEEIAMILPDTLDAHEVAERLRASIAETLFPTDNGNQIIVTVSIGVAYYPGDGASAEELVAAADTALYCAKEGGRNRVCVFEKPASA